MRQFSLGAIKASLSGLAARRGVTGKKNADIVERNFGNWHFAFRVWSALAVDLGYEELFDTIYDLCEGDAYNAVTVAVGIADSLVGYMSEHNELPFPYTNCNARELLTFLRFLKRLSIVDATWLVEDARAKFWQCMDNHWNPSATISSGSAPDGLHPSVLDRYTNPWFYSSMLPHLQASFRYLFPDDLRLVTKEFSFSNGAVQDSCTHPFCKWVAATYRKADDSMLGEYLSRDPVIGRPPFDPALEGDGPACERAFIKNVGHPNQDVWHLYGHRTEWYCVKPMTVPKQLTSVRVICPEDAYHARIQLSYSESLLEYWVRNGIATRDDSNLYAPIQSYNQAQSRRACRAAQAQKLATIDCTACSDTVRRDFLRLMNNPTVDAFISVMPTHIRWGKVTRRMEMFGTMGSPLTFPMEEGVMYALAMWAIDYAKLWLGDPSLPETLYVVGDDVILPQYAAETFVDALRACCMLPNVSKTFTHGNYFESCGEEAWLGQSVAGLYFPRGFDLHECDVAKWDAYDNAYKSPLGSLMELANRLYHEGWLGAQQVVVEELANYGSLHFDPTETPGTLHGIGVAYEIVNLLTGEKRTSAIADAKFFERYLVTAVRAYPISDGGKKGCWCHTLDEATRETMLRTWSVQRFCVRGPIYNSDLDRLLNVTAPDYAALDYGTRVTHVLSLVEV